MNEKKMDMNTVLVTGYAKAPTGTAMFEQYKHSGLVLEIDKSSSEIVDVEFTLVTNLAKRYFKKLFIGYDLINEMDVLIKKIEENYFAPSASSVIIALKTARQRYIKHLSDKE